MVAALKKETERPCGVNVGEATNEERSAQYAIAESRF